ncbi:membrane hypothetical protein [Candidatus Magnetomoraceae bacterium gMMP-15]
MEKKSLMPLLIGIILFSLLLGFISGNSSTSVVGQLLSVLFPALASVIAAWLSSKTEGINYNQLMKHMGYFLIIFSIAFSAGSFGGYSYRIEKKVFYKLTLQSLNKLKKEGMDSDIIEKLTKLSGKKYTDKDNFLDAIKAKIEKKIGIRDEELVLKYAKEERIETKKGHNIFMSYQSTKE